MPRRAMKELWDGIPALPPPCEKDGFALLGDEAIGLIVKVKVAFELSPELGPWRESSEI